jgi:hypothetical protein
MSKKTWRSRDPEKARPKDICPVTGRPTTTRWIPAKGERFVGKWPPPFRAKNKPKRKWVRIATWGDYLRAMIDRHGSVEAWQAARDAELNRRSRTGPVAFGRRNSSICNSKILSNEG